MELFIEFAKVFGLPGVVLLAGVICVYFTTQSSTKRNDAESDAIRATANLASQSQTEAFNAHKLLLTATERLAELEIRVAQLENEGKQKDTIIAKLQLELSEVQGTVATLNQALEKERAEKNEFARVNAALKIQVETLTQQIELLRKRMEQLGDDQLKLLSQEIEKIETMTPVLADPKTNEPKERV